MVGESDRDGFACSRAAVEIAAVLGAFGNGSDSPGTPGGTAGAAPAQKQAAKPKKRGGGVLPAVSNPIRQLPGALPRPSIPTASSPHRVIGLAAVVLLILSGLALVLYVLRFIRGLHAT